MRATMLAVALALILPVGAEAGGRSGGRGHASSGGAKSSHTHHHHHHGGAVFIGTGVYYGYPYYYYPYYPADVPLYLQPGDPYWYYCRALNTYYPYVNSCPGGWERYLPGTPIS